MKKPKKVVIYITCSEKGGIRKSRTSSMLYHLLKQLGFDPICLALDTNRNFEAMLKGANALTWDLNNSDESRRKLEVAITLAEETGSPIIIDLPGKGGKSLGVQTLIRTGMMKFAAHVVGIVPTLPDQESAQCALGALATIAPDEWIHVKYKADEVDYNKPLHQQLATLEHQPAYVVTPPELTDEEASAIPSLPVSLAELEAHVENSGRSALGCLPYLSYWLETSRQLEEAVRAASPSLFEEALTSAHVGL